jgi:hypothetical protein
MYRSISIDGGMCKTNAQKELPPGNMLIPSQRSTPEGVIVKEVIRFQFGNRTRSIYNGSFFRIAKSLNLIIVQDDDARDVVTTVSLVGSSKEIAELLNVNRRTRRVNVELSK